MGWPVPHSTAGRRRWLTGVAALGYATEGRVAIPSARSLRVWAIGLCCGRSEGTVVTAAQLDPAFIAILSCLHCGAEVAQVERVARAVGTRSVAGAIRLKTESR